MKFKPEPQVFDLQKSKDEKIPGKDREKFIADINKANSVPELRALVKILATLVIGEKKL